MRIYEGSPRRDFEEVLRSIGAFLDVRGMRDILVLEVPDGFVVQGLAAAASGAWSESMGSIAKQTLTFVDDDIARFLDEAHQRRGTGEPASPPGTHERALRVIGHWIDGLRPRDIFLLEQDGAYVIRLLVGTPGGVAHQLAEFTAEDVASLEVEDAALRGRPTADS
jgi:hypothetical protein